MGIRKSVKLAPDAPRKIPLKIIPRNDNSVTILITVNTYFLQTILVESIL